MKRYGVNRELLPPKKISGNLSKQLIDKRRQLLERYLQRLIHNVVEIARSPELQVFLDVPTHVSNRSRTTDTWGTGLELQVFLDVPM